MKIIQLPHACELMNLFIDDPKVPIEYYPIMREYRLHLKHSPGKQGIYYCPWCGSKLPESLRDSYFETLENLYGEDFSRDNAPAEFQTDEWWKKRGL
jgi:hypothetical protein